ncbi:MAG TPA: class I SAM-dependent methyltransferase [bacterium]|nr:class I SAM-dependent methyltransferase [bacterium]
MTLHHFLGKGCLRLGRLIQSLAVAVMRPDDLVRFSRETYQKSDSIAYWCSDEFIASGLYAPEAALLERLPSKQGRLLLLGIGGGREAIPLAQAGFEVSGVDYLREYADAAREQARRRGLHIETVVGDIAKLDLAPASFDVIWFSHAIYSLVPTRQRRIAMLKTMHRTLTDQGQVVCQFHWDPTIKKKKTLTGLIKGLAFLTWGNIHYESGDMLWRNSEFLHAFATELDFTQECVAAGFKVEIFQIFPGWLRGGAVLIKEKN